MSQTPGDVTRIDVTVAPKRRCGASALTIDPPSRRLVNNLIYIFFFCAIKKKKKQTNNLINSVRLDCICIEILQECHFIF